MSLFGLTGVTAYLSITYLLSLIFVKQTDPNMSIKKYLYASSLWLFVNAGAFLLAVFINSQFSFF